MRHNRVLRLFVVALVLTLGLGLHAQMARAGERDDSLEVPSLEDISGKKLGIVNGVVFDKLIEDAGYDVTDDDFYYFNSNSETAGALIAGKVDVFITDMPVASLVVSKNDGLGIIPERFREDHYGFALQKGSELTPYINKKLKEYRQDGTLDALYKKWTGADDSAKTMPDFDDAPNGTLSVATGGDSEPMTYVSNGRVIGMCPEIMETIAHEMGYRLEYHLTSTSSMIAELESGKSDIAMSCLSITPERQKAVDMTEPFYDGGIAAIVRTKDGPARDKGFFEGIADSFTRTFIVENRWQMVASGLGVTLTISVCSGILGYLLGYAIVRMRRRGNRVVTALIDGFQELLGGLPIAVVLMIFYYVIFGSVSIPGVFVAICAFTLVFGASVGNIMWNAVCSIDGGQTEAGRALGFSAKNTFSLVVLPQAARRFLPLVRGQFVSMVKDTSVVGFIAVQDLTRVGDLIRARTMEAFFPLLATAFIYFVLCRLLALVLDTIIAKTDPTNGPRTIKGVQL